MVYLDLSVIKNILKQLKSMAIIKNRKYAGIVYCRTISYQDRNQFRFENDFVTRNTIRVENTVPGLLFFLQ